MKNKKYTPKNDSDSLNQDYMFQTTETDLLVAIANGLIDPIELVKKELANRGLDLNGKWIGFKK